MTFVRLIYKMEFRKETKQFNTSLHKLSQLESFPAKAMKRVNYPYTGHLIEKGNMCQRQIDSEETNTQTCIKYDLQATSTTGFIKHLNDKLAEMQVKSDNRQQQLLNALKKHHEDHISARTVPIQLLQFKSSNESGSQASYNLGRPRLNSGNSSES